MFFLVQCALRLLYHIQIAHTIQVSKLLGESCMVDYKDIGMRIRTVRKARKMTQEQLAEAVGVGVTHISHIETGNSIPSLKVLIDIINVLECSADELLCIEINAARPLFSSWIGDLLSDCTNQEIKLITDTVTAMKESLRRLRADTESD